MGFFKGKKLLLIGFLTILLAVIPLTVFYLVQNQTSTQSSAAPVTELNFQPTTTTKPVGTEFPIDIVVDPKTNVIIASTLTVTFDPSFLEVTKFEMAPAGTTQGFSNVLAGPDLSTPGVATISLTVGTDVTKAITTPNTKIATITFKGLKQTTSPTQVKFDVAKSNVTSANVADPEVNSINTSVAQLAAAQITLTGGTGPTLTPGPTATPGATPTTGPSTISCTNLTLDRAASGTAPYAITFTASGSSTSTATISKVTFDFGDGQTQDVTQGTGFGTKTVSAPISHTYANAGTYQAAATFTDSTNAISSKNAACTKTITVTAGQGAPGTGGTPTDPAVPTPTPLIITATPIVEVPAPAPIVPPSGPGEIILGTGIAGIVLTVLGTIFFFTL